MQRTSSTGARTGRGPSIYLTAAGILRSEWIKLKSLRAARTLFALTVVAIIVTGVGGAIALIGSQGGNELAQAREPASALHSAGLPLAQLLVGAVGVLFIATEYVSGSIRTTFTAVPRRVPVITAKAAVAGTASFAVGGASSLLTHVAVQVVLAASGTAVSMFHPASLISAVATGLYLAFIAVIGVSLGVILRSTAAGIVLLVVLLSVLPGLVPLLPLPGSEQYPLFFPAQAGAQMIAVVQEGLLTQWQGGVVMALWAGFFTLAAAAWIRKRDI
ncbi:hypothetical protein E2F48_14145 [Arthrobacter crusticola]|uniref:ABC transporter permease n=1 Tax=Arthrobacter crusticola TaxID=2547960 RepID=A0A4R5TNH6_9MICC|nr:hypothetical protein [Arthrobacter crusticola]TDK23933.1 hypothetical protein E2F48_14145 [Arthrobacter crusticola]